ncbi:MAG: penicillin-binding protein 2, partial [Actinomycetes bacterium]
GARAFLVGVVAAASLKRDAAVQQSTTAPVPASRGDITDRNGVELAVSEPMVTVTADPMMISNPSKVAAQVAPLIGRSVLDIEAKLSNHKQQYVRLARKVSVANGKRVRSLKINGIDFEKTMGRSYPRGAQAGQLIGLVGDSGHGMSGLELSFDKTLAGSDGERTTVTDRLGQPILVTDSKTVKSGGTLQLTIDAPVQDEVERVLAGVGRVFQPKGATAIVMDPRTGNILALANWPAVNANSIGTASDYAQMNRASGFTYEPGSTFKAFTVASALEDHKVTPDSMFNLPTLLHLGDKTIKDAHDRGAESLSVSSILAQSSNVGAALIGLKIGRHRVDHWIRRFGFATPTNSGFSGEERGLLLPLSKYSAATVGNEAMGQGLAVTPLQMVQGYAALANGGVLRSPRIAQRANGVPIPVAPGHRVISERVSRLIRNMLRGVLAEGGTASGAEIPGFDLAGKTGTAQKVDPVTGTYSSSRYIASFIGFAPARSPKLLTAVLVDEPQGDIYGGSVAAPAFSRIMAFALPYLGITPR